MKIYFAGSIRGGRDDQAIYTDVISILKKYGDVLTEHIGLSTISSYGQTDMTDEEIYTKDINWIIESDIVVAEVTNSSVGVGYEIGYAEALNKKIIILYRPQEGTRLSAMIRGNSKVTVVNYIDVSELPVTFDKLLQ